MMDHHLQSVAQPVSHHQPAADAKTRILDTAERLFADRGFERTSIKRLAGEAGVNQAAVNYYFGSKATLIEKVIERRMGPLNRQRQEALEAVRQRAAGRGCRPLAEDVLWAFIEPAFTRQIPMAVQRHFLALGARALFEPDSIIRLIFERQFQPSFQLLFEVMHEALPDLPEEVLLIRLHFALGTMAHCMRICSNRGGASADLLHPVGDLRAMSRSLLAFVTPGICAPVNGRKGNETP